MTLISIINIDGKSLVSASDQTKRAQFLLSITCFLFESSSTLKHGFLSFYTIKFISLIMFSNKRLSFGYLKQNIRKFF